MMPNKGSWRIYSIWESPTSVLILGEELINVALSILSIKRERLKAYIPPSPTPPSQTAGTIEMLVPFGDARGPGSGQGGVHFC